MLPGIPGSVATSPLCREGMPDQLNPCTPAQRPANSDGACEPEPRTTEAPECSGKPWNAPSARNHASNVASRLALPPLHNSALQISTQHLRASSSSRHFRTDCPTALTPVSVTATAPGACSLPTFLAACPAGPLAACLPNNPVWRGLQCSAICGTSSCGRVFRAGVKSGIRPQVFQRRSTHVPAECPAEAIP